MKTTSIVGMLTGAWVLWGLVLSCPAIAPITVLQRMEERWNRLEQLQVDLEQTIESCGEEQQRRYIGSLYILRGEHLRMDFQRVEAATASRRLGSATLIPEDIYLANPDFLWHYDTRTKVVTRQYLAEAELPPILQALAGTRAFSAEEFRQNYDIRPVVQEEIQAEPTYCLSFRPKGPEKETLVHYQLWLSQETYLPVRLRISAREEVIQVNFLNPRTEYPLPENIFEVRVPDDVQWVDRTEQL